MATSDTSVDISSQVNLAFIKELKDQEVSNDVIERLSVLLASDKKPTRKEIEDALFQTDLLQ